MKMKFNKILGIFAATMLLASCESSSLIDEPAPAEGALRIANVTLDGFEADGQSRTDYNDAYATIFEEGDRLGLILVGEDGSQKANVPFTYTADGTWNNDLNQLYSSEVARIVAYFPYNPSLGADITGAAALKASVTVPADQSDKAVFTAADLLVGELNAPGAELNVDLAHAFSLLRFSSKETVTAGNRDFEYSVALNGLKISVGDDVYTPCTLNGGYVAIVRDNTSLQPELFKYSYTRFGEDPATKTLKKAVNTVAGTAYSFSCPPAGAVSTAIGAGDYYCVTEDDGMVVVIPAGASAIPAGLVCQGIVFHTMDNTTFGAFAADNGLTAAEYPGIDGAHGLIVSMKGAGLILSGYNAGDVDKNEFLKGVFENTEDSGNTDVSNGYRLTGVLSAAYGVGNAGVTFTGLEGFDVPLTYCTSWYVPSFNELKYLVRGSKTPGVVSTDGLDMVNARLTSASGDLIEGNLPSVSYKKYDGFCIMQNGEEMGWHGVPDGEKCRPICAF